MNKVSVDCINSGAKKEDILTIIGDVSIENDVKNIVESTIKFFGQLDILVNNAGILIPGAVENTSLENYDQTMNINVRSLFQLTQLAVPYLKKTRGNIVNVSSIAGPRSFPGVAAYCLLLWDANLL